MLPSDCGRAHQPPPASNMSGRASASLSSDGDEDALLGSAVTGLSGGERDLEEPHPQLSAGNGEDGAANGARGARITPAFVYDDVKAAAWMRRLEEKGVRFKVLQGPHRWVIRFDGGSIGNPGAAGSGAVLFQVINGMECEVRAVVLPIGRNVSNNQAEILGLVTGVHLLRQSAPDLAMAGVTLSHVLIEGDSKMVIDAVLSRWWEAPTPWQDCIRQVQGLLARVEGGVWLRHILRNGNARADELSKRACARVLERAVPTAYEVRGDHEWEAADELGSLSPAEGDEASTSSRVSSLGRHAHDLDTTGDTGSDSRSTVEVQSDMEARSETRSDRSLRGSSRGGSPVDNHRTDRDPGRGAGSSNSENEGDDHTECSDGSASDGMMAGGLEEQEADVGDEAGDPREQQAEGVVPPPAATAHTVLSAWDRARIRTECTRLLLFGCPTVLATVVRNQVRQAVGPECRDDVRLVQAVLQPNGRARHDVWVVKRSADSVTASLMKPAIRRQHGWAIKQDIPFATRRAAATGSGGTAPPAPPPPTYTQSRVTVCSANVTTMSGKRMGLGWWCRKQHVTVMGLQETLRKPDSFKLRVPGYQGFESFADKERGGRGVALLVVEGVNAVRLGVDNPHFVFVLVSANAPFRERMLIGSVYIPQASEPARQRDVLKQLAKEVQRLQERFAGVPMVVLGDFNMTADRLNRWFNKCNLDLRVNPGSGCMRTYRRGLVQVSGIDHVALSMAALRMFLKSWVDRAFHLSGDHFAVLARAATGGGATSVEAAAPAKANVVVHPRKWEELPVAQQYEKQSDRRHAVAGRIATHNRFEALNWEWTKADESDDEVQQAVEGRRDVGAMAAAFQETVHKVMEDIGARKQVDPNRRRHGGNKLWLRPKTRKAIQDHHAAFEALMTSDENTRAGCEEALKLASRASKRAVRLDERTRWLSFLDRQVAAANTPREMWEFTRMVSAYKGKTPHRGLTPLIDRDNPGVLAVTHEDIARVTVNTVSELFRDNPPNTRTEEYWQEAIGAPLSTEVNPDQLLPGLMTEVTWSAVLVALKRAKGGTAPGVDEIHAAFYKTVLEEEGVAALREKHAGALHPQEVPLRDGGTQEDPRPRSELGVALLRLLQAVWAQSEIPDCWSDIVLCYIPKKGSDPLNLDEQRPIALINTVRKLLTLVVTLNVSEALETNGVLAPEQAGFRPREECIAQVATLVECVARRRAAGLHTILFFVDYKSAFHTVSHEGLWARCRQIGIGGPVLRYLQGLYDSTRLRVRMGDGSLTDAVQPGRGLHMGCPFSPCAFTIYVNTYPEEFDDLGDGRLGGVTVPGLDIGRPSGPNGERRMRCLMLADDVVNFCDSVKSAWRTCERMCGYSERRLLFPNGAKCALMVCSPNGPNHVAERRKLCRKLERHPERRMAGGVAVPVVDRYPYLGVPITHDLSLEAMVADRRDKVVKATAALTPFLRQHAIPLDIRAKVLRGVIAGTSTYGIEVWGGCEKRVAPLQSALNRAFRVTLGMKAGNNMASVTAMGRELGCPPVQARAYGMIARLPHKFPRLKTYGKDVWESGPVPDKYSKGSVLKRWRLTLSKIRNNRYEHPPPEDEEAGDGEAADDGQAARKWARTVVSCVTHAKWEHMVEQEQTRGVVSEAAQWHRRYLSAGNGLATHRAMWPAGLGVGLTAISKMRVRGFPNITRLRRFVKGYDDGRCVLCDAGRDSGVLETDAHLVLECEAWADARQEFLGDLIAQGERLMLGVFGGWLDEGDLDLRAERLLALLLGGAVDGVFLPNWLWVRGPYVMDDAEVDEKDDLSQTSRDDGHQPGGGVCVPNIVGEAGCIRLARFLRHVLPLRFAGLRRHEKEAASAAPSVTHVALE